MLVNKQKPSSYIVRPFAHREDYASETGLSKIQMSVRQMRALDWNY
jgi:hypothetical protein